MNSSTTFNGERERLMMDQNKLRTLVFEKTGIRIDTMDPVFALVALNEAVLDDSVAQQAAVINAAADRLSEQADRLEAASQRYADLLQQLENTTGSETHERRHAIVGEAGENQLPGAEQQYWRRHAGSAAIALATALLTVLILWITGLRSAV
ncbi:MAG: hypothetical protein H7315_17200 [Herminiimonas sp.]|nr:hypothetical protein [Herminiimonas sp.]